MPGFQHIDFNAIDAKDLLVFFEQRHHAYVKSMLELILRNFDSALHQENTLHEGAEYLLNLLLELRKNVDTAPARSSHGGRVTPRVLNH
jgi:hypothetical protein